MNKTGLGLFLAIFSGVAAANTPLPDVQPYSEGQHVFINIPQQRLFLYTNGELTKAYPVAVGKAATQTNLGRHLIGAKAYNPTWHIPKSIQKELKDGKTTIPPGPSNPLGPVFVRMGDPKLGLGIHGTNAPASVPGVRSHGCVRMKSPDALEFAQAINTGTPVDVIYQMASLNADANNNLWLAAYRDPYRQNNLDTKALETSVKKWAQTHGKTVHTKRLTLVLKNKTGALNCITCGSKNGKVPSSLKSLAWTNGDGELSKSVAPPPKPVPQQDEVLPEGSEIEIDAGTDTLPASERAPQAPQTEQEPTYFNAIPPASDNYQSENNGTSHLF
ncbi:L,D-transpeptidase [Neisseria wadsworthii]|uniref:ErfK/YbiS/YcfS/YnhG family protein n=1 Tax=Neisseria wadsworthii 9715 TaxID=1030841 RepID=G4CSW4_9NEIS|nr:L,D-transpeptidase [Neisseria wadsworthii]EGZ44544.1 ErfK/YbiS/YcfS/YnhG family protein [Neisseria wadsworthii 9715]QMT35781.1 L,D-transpeptidase [Neisseria wadsworthii]